MTRGLIFIGLLSVFFSCSNSQTSSSESTEDLSPSNLTGKELAKLYCGNCHMFLEPSMLPKDIWLKRVLPKMALRLGQGQLLSELTSLSNEEMMSILENKVYPDKPMMHADDWEKIINFYGENAPDSLRKNISIEKNKKKLQGFDINFLKSDLKNIVMTQWDVNDNTFVVANAYNNKVYKLGLNNNLVEKLKTESPAVDFKTHKQLGKIWLEIGGLNPTDVPSGRLVAESPNKVLIDKLRRPVHLDLLDINEDGFEDFVICNFGNNIGNLSWYDGKTMEEHLLSSDPGARKTYILDFDGDNKKDIIVLMTQGKEQIVFYKNMGKGRFESKTLIKFLPLFGSSYFEMVDIDKDGDLDIIYTNGDNADLSPVLKYYHGVRIFENNNNKFTQKYFYGINGASKVIVEDFDGDNDLDMAIISFFPDLNKNESFIYLENNGENTFLPKIDERLSKIKWLTLDKGDFDNDGEWDIILGGFGDLNVEYKDKNKKSIAVLKNKL